MKCGDCPCLEELPSRNGGIRSHFFCRHKNQKYIYEYCEEHRIHKMPGFVCYGGGLYGQLPTIKTSPAWCPHKKEAKP